MIYCMYDLVWNTLDKKKRVAHPLKEPNYSLGINVLECGLSYRDITHPIEDRPWIRRTHIMVFLLGGEGKLESASTGLTNIKTGDAFIIPAGIWHRYGPEITEEWKEFWICFDGFIAETILTKATTGQFDSNGCLLINITITDELVSIFKSMVEYSDNNDSSKCAVCFFELMQIIERRFNSKKKEAKQYGCIKKIIKRIDNNPCKDIDFKKEASDTGISYELLRKQFVSYTGLPPYRYLLNQRMQYACNLLANGKSVKETCYEIAMKDPSHFSKLFKNLIGVSPKGFVDKISK